MIKFIRKPHIVSGYEYTAQGEFRRGIVKIKLCRANKKAWSIIIFRENEVQGEYFIKDCVSLTDAKVTATQYFN
jgi:hypothetical protein